MMSRLLRMLVVLLVLLAACGGDSEGADDGDTGDTADGSTTTTQAPTTTTTTQGPSVSVGNDACEFLIEYADQVYASPVGLAPEQIQSNYTATADALSAAADAAPSEIQADVQMYADAYAGLIDFLSEYEWNFLSIPEADLEDPRLAALDDPELTAAGDRIEDFCDFEFIDNAPPDPGPGAGPGGLPGGGEIPDDFPTALAPPGGEVVAAITVAGASSVTFDLAGDTDEIIAFYTDELGAPVQALETPKGALWVTDFEGSALTLTVAETGPNMVQVNVTLGG